MKAPRLSVFLPMLVGLLWPAGAFALGLGDATVNSRLNEPLSVEISLIRTELSSSNKHVFAIASASAHAAAGIIYSELVQQLEMEIVSDDGGNTILRVMSRDRVHQPVVSFLLEFQNSGVREGTRVCAVARSAGLPASQDGEVVAGPAGHQSGR